MSILARYFRLSESNTSVRTELVAGVTTFLTMAYIIFVQPAVLSGAMFETPTGMDFGAVTTATCLAAALATAVMGLAARYPIALAPGMGQNFFFVFTAIPAAAAVGAPEPWAAALGAVFVAGVLFLVISLVGLREKLMDAVSPNLKHGIAVGIGLFIAFIGLRNAQLVLVDPGTAVSMNPHLGSPDVIVFFVGFVVATVLHARKVRGSIVLGVASSLALTLLLRSLLPLLPDAVSNSEVVTGSLLVTQFAPAHGIVALPPSMGPTFLQMDLATAVSAAMIPIVIIFLFMDVFDTMGTLIGVGEQAGLLRDGKLPRVKRAMLADAFGTVAGAALGTSTVTSYIESATGVEEGGKTGLTALVVAALFIAALFFYPIVAMVGSYPPITAPALVLVGAMMVRNVTRIDWTDYTEGVPAFLTIIGIPFFYSIADGIALGLITYPVIKSLGRGASHVRWGMWVLAVVLLLYFVFVRSRI
ncbi:MAG: NCS2 family permease [Gemmatimonadetes bacterium]|nr:NCS2 family permease [Gemmatimonadota bacterium]